MTQYYQLDASEQQKLLLHTIRDEEIGSSAETSFATKNPLNKQNVQQVPNTEDSRDIIHCILGSWRNRLPLTMALFSLVVMMYIALSRLTYRIESAFEDDENSKEEHKSFNQHFYDIHNTCIPGTFRDVNSQLRTFSWELPTQSSDGNSLKMPMYWTRPIDQTHSDIKQIIIIQHGNLRNANEYFCGALTSIQELQLVQGSHEFLHNGERLDSVLIVAPHFLIEGDLCWKPDSESNQATIVSRDDSCGQLLWTSEGWKDGLNSISMNAPINFFSYDVFNVLINHFSNRTKYPNVEEIILFGFSAGGQTLLRYSMWPAFISTPGVRVRSVVGDMSTYLYLDKRRPFTNGTIGFGIPNKEWIPSNWNIDRNTGRDWIKNWEGNCEKYNSWRYGLEALNGYFGYHSNRVAEFTTEVVREFPHRFVDYLVGLNDSTNCNLDATTGFINSSLQTSHCNDNELATYCQAMLQGDNRFDRFIKWKSYLEDKYDPKNEDDNAMPRPNIYSYGIKGTNSAYYLVKNVSHDAIQMLRSRAAKCVVFGHCDLID